MTKREKTLADALAACLPLALRECDALREMAHDDPGDVELVTAADEATAAITAARLALGE